MKTKILRNFEKSLKTFKDRNFLEELSDDIGVYQNLGYQVFSQFSPDSAQSSLILLQNFFYKRGFSPNIFGIYSQKSLKLQRVFNNLKRTKDKDEDGSLVKNLQRTKTFEGLLQQYVKIQMMV